MEIDQAYSNMLSALPFEEQGLARDIIESSRMDPETKAIHRRAPSLNLSETIDSAVKQAGLVPRRINIYCDTLTINANTVLDKLNDRGLRLSIYTRSIITESSPAMTVVLNERSALNLFVTEAPTDFTVVFIPKSTGQKINKPFNPGGKKFGISAELSNGDVSVTLEDGPEIDAVDTIDYLKQVGPDGRLIPDKWVNDNLPRLLQFQFLVATTQIDRNRALALRLLNFVCTATDTDASRDFNLQATALRCSILARQGTGVSIVPSVNVFESKNVLQARLLAATSFEQAFQEFVSQEKTSGQLQLFAGNALAANKNALTEYAFLEGSARKSFEDASMALDKAQAKFKAEQADLDKKGKDFEAGIKEWKIEQEKAAAKEIILGIVEFAGAIAATVATAGLAAPAAGMAAANMAKTVGKVAGLIAKIKDVIAKIKELYEKFKPLLESVQKLVEAIKTMIAIIKQAKDIADQPKQLQRADADADPINGAAMWDAFTEDVRIMFEGLKEYSISGKEDYQRLLLHLPIYAKAVLTAQVAVVTTGQNLATILLRKRLDTEQQARLEKCVKFISQDSELLNILKRAMFDRVLAVRNLVYLDFWRYRAAFQYYSLTRESDLNIYISAVQRIADYQADAARMQAVVSSFGATVRIQSKSFAFSVPLGADQRSALSSGKGNLKYQPSITSSEVADYARVRLFRVRAFLEGFSVSSSKTPVKLQINTSGQFLDLDFPGNAEPLPKNLIPEGSSLTSVVNDNDDTSSVNSDDTLVESRVVLPRAFIGEPRMVVFEYGTNEEIVCDGYFGLQNDFTRQTPFQEFTLSVRKGSTSIDWDAVKSIRWEFMCEICAV